MALLSCGKSNRINNSRERHRILVRASGPDVPAAEHFHGRHFLRTVSTTSIRRTMGYSGTNQDEQFTGSSDCRYYITSLTAFCARRLTVLFKKKAQIAEVKGLGD
jgi:hypothetical protein